MHSQIAELKVALKHVQTERKRMIGGEFTIINDFSDVYCTSYYLVQRIWPTTSKGAASIVRFQKIDIHATFQNNDVGHMRSDIQYTGVERCDRPSTNIQIQQTELVLICKL